MTRKKPKLNQKQRARARTKAKEIDDHLRLQRRIARQELFIILERGCPAAVSANHLRDCQLNARDFFAIAVQAPGGLCWWPVPGHDDGLHLSS